MNRDTKALAAKLLRVVEAESADGHADPETDLGSADSDGREVVRLSASRINETTRKCAEVLSGELFMRGAFPAALVRVEDLDRGRGAEDDEPEPGVVLGGIRHASGTLVFAEPSPERLLYRLDELLAFERLDSKSRKWVRTSCPPAIARRVIGAASEVGLRSCAAIVTVPLFVDGEIVGTPGYHPGRRVFLDVPPELPSVPESPTKQDALWALDVLLAPFTGYIAGQGEQDALRLKCSTSAAALTAVVRPSLPHAPAVLVDAEVPGAGKGKYARALSVIATGRLPSMVTEGHAEEEVEKRMASAILTGSAAIMIDNLQRTLASSTLESGLTEGYATIRIFGKLADVTVPCAAFIVITANNATLRADMLRRTLPVRIVAGTDKPETRVFDFDPYDVAVRRRAEIVAAGLTIAKAWWLARDSEEGRRIRKTTLGSFERWADLVAGAVEWLTGMNPVKLIEDRKAGDPARNAEWHVVTALHELFGEREWTAKEAAGEPAKVDGRDGCVIKEATGLDPDVWASVIPLKGPRPSPLQVGQWLNKRKDRVWGDWQLVSSLDRNGIARWRIVELRGLRGSAGVIPTPRESVSREKTNGVGSGNPGQPPQPPQSGSRRPRGIDNCAVCMLPKPLAANGLCEDCRP
jgi:putative DNA primase/helicase